jgi:hypothetical protein
MIIFLHVFMLAISMAETYPQGVGKPLVIKIVSISFLVAAFYINIKLHKLSMRPDAYARLSKFWYAAAAGNMSILSLVVQLLLHWLLGPGADEQGKPLPQQWPHGVDLPSLLVCQDFLCVCPKRGPIRSHWARATSFLLNSTI